MLKIYLKKEINRINLIIEKTELLKNNTEMPKVKNRFIKRISKSY